MAAGAAVAEERSGFLGRWARRKTEALQGQPLDEPAVPLKPAAAPAAPVAAPVAGAGAGSGVAGAALPRAAPDANGEAAASPAQAAQPAEKLLSLEDVKGLGPDADFKPFMARSVGADVRNAAMKKLFTDPHYNVMDGLDIYIDDYSRADPIPPAMLRQMASAQFLNLFDDEQDGQDKPDPAADKDRRDDSRSAAAQGDAAFAPASPPDGPEAQCGMCPAASPSSFSSTDNFSQPPPAQGAGASLQDDHAHPHLRLQPDHAPSAPRTGGGAA